MRPSKSVASARRSLHRLGWLLICVLVVGCEAGSGGGGDSDEANAYRFIRSKDLLVRIDTAKGQVWWVPASGDGGWIALGSRPSDGGLASDLGRYAIFNLQLQQRGARRPNAPQSLLRIDRMNGRTWTIEAMEGAAWSLIAETEGSAMASAESGDFDADSSSPRASGEPPSSGEPPAPAVRDEGASRTAAGHEPVPYFQVLLPKERFGETTEEQKEGVKALVNALRKEGLPVEMKVWAARQLGVFDPEVAVPPLLDTLESEHPEVVVAAIGSLQQIGQASTIPQILKLQQHPDARVRAAVDATVMELP